MLGIIHPLPEQNNVTDIKSYFINLKTGERIPFNFPDKQSPELTKREEEVLRLIQQGLLTKEIAEKLAISIHTVNIHRRNILQKMNVHNSAEAIHIGRKYNFLE